MSRLFQLPIVSTIPRSGTWFLRYSLSFLRHFARGGRIDDRVTGEVFGNPSGPAFDFAGFRGGPLFDMRGTPLAGNIFVGHTVCPGFDSSRFGWWHDFAFHVPGYDYFADGHDYRYTPIELHASPYDRVAVTELEDKARRGQSGPMMLVYRDPIDQAASYYRYCSRHRDPRYRSFKGKPIEGMSFREYLFEAALPSYAKMFVSYQEQSRLHPGQVMLVPYERMVANRKDVLRQIVDHLTGACLDWPWLSDAVALTRRSHLRAIEQELGKSLDGTRADFSSHITRPEALPTDVPMGDPKDAGLRDDVMARLRDWRIDTSMFAPSFRSAGSSAVPASLRPA